MKEEFEKLYKLKLKEDTTDKTIDMQIEGIASVYDTIDKDGELIKTGAFDSQIGKTIPIYDIPGWLPAWYIRNWLPIRYQAGYRLDGQKPWSV